MVAQRRIQAFKSAYRHVYWTRRAGKVREFWLRTVSRAVKRTVLGGARASLGIRKIPQSSPSGFMIFNKDDTSLEGKPKCVVLSDVEKDIGNHITLYAHAITRGGSKVAITPSSAPVVWLPNAPAVGGDYRDGVDKFEAATLGQYLRLHEDTSGVPKCKGLVRPVFEMKASQPTQGGTGTYALMPAPPPRAEGFVVVHDEEIGGPK